MELAKSDYIQAAVMLHPSFVTVDDIKGTVPVNSCRKLFASNSQSKVMVIIVIPDE